jgi:hypothetical protein
MKQSLLLAGIILTFISCQSNQSSKPLNQAGSSSHEVVVKEVYQVSGYTYLLVTENGNETWLATTPIEAKVGETYYYDGGFEMNNFKSKELNRTFQSIFFLEGISSTPIVNSEKASLVSPGAASAREVKKNLSITPVDGTVTIAELFSNKASYEGETIKVKAEVTKFSPQIMGTNWIHVQDGTESEGDFDLTITSKEIVNVGETLIFEGKITLDKDLGYGYFFEVLMEDAKVSK